MSTPAPNPNETSASTTIPDTSTDGSIRSRLPRKNDSTPPAEIPPPPPPAEPVTVSQPVENKPKRWGSGLLPAFWTVASIISITVNIILIVILLLMWQMLGNILKLTNTQVSGLLGGLYTNFVKMDQATINRTIQVKADIPLNIVVPVQATTGITLAEKAVIPNAHVVINTPSMSINAPAQVTLPAGTPLTVTLNFPLTVQNTIPVQLDVPVNIPLNETDLHEPFVGLQKVVEPWYCLVKPDAQVNGVMVCSPMKNDAPSGTVTP